MLLVQVELQILVEAVVVVVTQVVQVEAQVVQEL
jgi:hypothetical protein